MIKNINVSGGDICVGVQVALLRWGGVRGWLLSSPRAAQLLYKLKNILLPLTLSFNLALSCHIQAPICSPAFIQEVEDTLVDPPPPTL